MQFRVLLLVVWCASAGASPAPDWVTVDADGQRRVHLWFFWSEKCPHCLDARTGLEQLQVQLPWLVVHPYEVSGDPANARRYVDLARLVGQEARAVPGFILCGGMATGFAPSVTIPMLAEWAAACRDQGGAASAPPDTAPLPGGIDPRSLSLPTVTVLLAAMDAFNPCAFFVLLFLLSLLTHEHSRARMLLVGGVFVTVSGLVYFGLMAAWLNLFLVAGELRLLTLAAGAVAVLMAGINLKDYLWPGRGVSLSIPDSARPRLYGRVRRLLQARRLPALLLGTVTLALAANSYELLCTAGFPVVYTRLLTIHELSVAAYYGYLALYNLVYVLPLLLIVLLYVRTLGSRKLGAAEGRVLKLVSGLMMLGLGVALLLAPGALSRPEVAGGLVLLAVLGGWLGWRWERGPGAAGNR